MAETMNAGCTLESTTSRQYTTAFYLMRLSRRAPLGKSSEIRVFLGLIGKNYRRIIKPNPRINGFLKMQSGVPALANMATKKRKSDAGEEGDQPGKRAKVSVGITSSILKEEAPFPRGGASVLTPLEHKQIKIQAKEDVLFEQNTGKKAPRHDFDDEDTDELSEAEVQGAVEPKPKKGKTSKRQKKDGASMTQEKTLRVESLSYKVRVSAPSSKSQLTTS